MRKFILDSDWWTDCDDAVAVRLLCNAHIDQEIQLLGIHINACMEYSIASLDVFTRDTGVTVPLGLDIAAVDFGGVCSYQKHLAEVRPVQRRNQDVPVSLDFYRQILSAATDGDVEILSIGFPQALAAMLESPEDRRLVENKVRHLWIMAGKWDEDGGKEYNFACHTISRHAGAKLCRDWPSGITFLGWEVGYPVITAGNLPEDDLLYQVMADHGHPLGRSSWDPMLALLAICGSPEKAGYSAVYGQASLDADTGANHFVESAAGKHRYVKKLHPDSYYADQINARLPLKK